MKTRVCILGLIVALAAGCNGSGDDGATLDALPRYPGAEVVESMEQSMLGIVGGELVQLSTRDSYDAVLEFYTEALADRELTVLSHQTELGRQTALSLGHGDDTVTIAIQEFVNDGAVNITLMRVRAN